LGKILATDTHGVTSSQSVAISIQQDSLVRGADTPARAVPGGQECPPHATMMLH